MIICTCGSDSKVYDTRPRGNTYLRRRECLACARRWQTVEIDMTAATALEAITEALVKINVGQIETVIALGKLAQIEPIPFRRGRKTKDDAA
jgi:hypothetical protein